MKWIKEYKIVSFYTPDYAEHAQRLIESIDRHLPETPHEIVAIPQRKWAEATCHKAHFLTDQIEKTDRPLVWIDADAEVMSSELVFPDVDFAIYARFASHLRHQFSPFRTGTVFFGNTDNAKTLIGLWISESMNQPDGIDQWSLFRAWTRAMGDPSVMPSTYWLRIAYCQKIDEKAGEPLIVHHMASRTLRRSK